MIYLEHTPIKYLPNFSSSVVAKRFRPLWIRNLKGYLVTAQSRKPLPPELGWRNCSSSAYVTTPDQACDNIVKESSYV